MQKKSQHHENQSLVPLSGGVKWRARLYKAIGITVVAFVMSYVLAQPFSFSAGTLMSSSDRKDFNMTDFYTMVADSRPVRAFERDIVVVNIDHTTRADIVDLLNILAMLNPRAVGLDVTFNEPKPDDDLLFEAIADCPNLVLAQGVKQVPGTEWFVPDDNSYFFEETADEFHYGVINLASKFEGATVREFPLWFTDSVGGRWPSFEVALAQLADPDAVQRLMARGNEREIIAYPSKTFRVIDWADVPDLPEEIEGKIVLVGAMTELDDVHATPLSDRLTGVMIHAYALNTVLKGDYYSKVHNGINLAIAVALCFLLAFAHVSLPVGVKGLTLRIVQVAVLYLIMRIGYSLFVDHRTLVDFSYALLMLTFVLFAADVWIGCSYLISKVSHNKKK